MCITNQAPLLFDFGAEHYRDRIVTFSPDAFQTTAFQHHGGQNHTFVEVNIIHPRS